LGGSVNLGNIIREIAPGGGGVSSLQDATGAVGTGALIFDSTDGSTNISIAGQYIDITSNINTETFATVSALEGVNTTALLADANATVAQTTANAAAQTANGAFSNAQAASDAANTAQASANSALAVAQRAIMYNLTGITMGANITNRGTGVVNAFPATTFTLASSITFNIPPDWFSTDSVCFDGWVLYNFQANINTLWGAQYITDTYATPTDILGSTSVVGDALVFPTSQQAYIPVNLIIPPTHLTSGGTITISFYGYITTGGSYFAAAPVIAGRVGLAFD
jgi:hypothetical protein